MDTIVNPKDITHYDRTDAQLQTFWVFCILVAGKNSDTTSRLVHLDQQIEMLERGRPELFHRSHEFRPAVRA